MFRIRKNKGIWNFNNYMEYIESVKILYQLVSEILLLMRRDMYFMEKIHYMMLS